MPPDALLITLCSVQVYAQLPTSADNVTLLAFAAELRPCSNRSASPGRRAHSSKLRFYFPHWIQNRPLLSQSLGSVLKIAANPPKWCAADERWDGQTDRQTNRRTLDSFIDPAPHTMRSVSISHQP